VLSGIDVSSYQGAPGQWQAEAGDYDFAAVKLTELMIDGSRYTDPDASADWQYLKSAGKGRIAYLFGHPGSSASDSVTFFLSVLASVGLDDADAVAIDFETTDGRNAAQCSIWAKMAARQLQSAVNRPVVIYTFPAFAQAGNCSGLGTCPLWIASPGTPPGKPEIPAPWTTWTLQQTDITPPLDRDVAAFATPEAMAAALGRKVAPVVSANYTTSGAESLQQVADAAKTSPSHVLALTAIGGGKFSDGAAAYINGVFGATIHPASPMPAGIVLKVPA
jgi:GH25 family lysozyme M1 (1,4-beta-N-acetylmuramidase)